MINKILVYTVSISILLGVLIIINRVMNFKHKQSATILKQKKLLPKIIDNTVENQFYWGNDEIIN
jgi:hypothetical protein